MSDEFIKSSVDKTDDILLLEYFKDKTVLLLLPDASIRVTVRKFLAYIGIPTSNVDIVEDLGFAKRFIEIKKPNVVIVADLVDKKKGIDLFPTHLLVRPNRRDALFCLISSYQSMIMAGAEKEDLELEMLIPRPFTYDDFQNAFLNYFRPKIEGGPLIELVETAKEKINLKDWEEAMTFLTKAQEIGSDAAIVSYYMGKISRFFGATDRALAFYEEGLKHDPDHFHCIREAIELYMEKKAYSEAQKLAERYLRKYPLSSRRLVDFVKLALVTKSYDYILRYCQILEEIPNFEIELLQGMAASLAVAAKQLIVQDKKELAQECLNQASRYCLNYPKILTNVVSAYLDLGDIDKADALLSRLIDDKSAPIEKHILNMEILYKVGDAPKALLLALALIRKKVKEKKVYEIAIEASIKMGRRKESILELIQDGSVKFPELAEYLNRI